MKRSPKKPVKQKQETRTSATGIKELDRVLGGGIQKGHVVLLAGSSGTGKTIFAFQWLFEGVRNGENGLYITLTEPLFNTLRNLEALKFYDKQAIENEKLKIVDIRDFLKDGNIDMKRTLDFIEKEVKRTKAKRLCIDSVTAIAYGLRDVSMIRSFIFELGKLLGSLGCTTVLTSEVNEENRYSVYGVEEFVSDTIIKLNHKLGSEAGERVMEIVKVRGTHYSSEELSFRITNEGVLVFPSYKIPLDYASYTTRKSTGIDALDEMLHGGVYGGSITLISGPTGSGKSLLCTQFIIDGLKKKEPCLYIGFEESEDQILRNADSFGWDLRKYVKQNLLILRCKYPLEMTPEEHLYEIAALIKKKKIKRCVIDSLSAFSSAYGDQQAAKLSRKVMPLVKLEGVTSYVTLAVKNLIGSEMLSDLHLSTISDNMIVLRYAEMDGELKHPLYVAQRSEMPCRS